MGVLRVDFLMGGREGGEDIFCGALAAFGRRRPELFHESVEFRVRVVGWGRLGVINAGEFVSLALGGPFDLGVAFKKEVLNSIVDVGDEGGDLLCVSALNEILVGPSSVFFSEVYGILGKPKRLELFGQICSPDYQCKRGFGTVSVSACCSMREVCDGVVVSWTLAEC